MRKYIVNQDGSDETDFEADGFEVLGIGADTVVVFYEKTGEDKYSYIKQNIAVFSNIWSVTETEESRKENSNND